MTMNTESLRGLVAEFDGRFRSSNNVPVDRIWLTKEMWERMRESLLNQAPAVQAADGWPSVDALAQIIREVDGDHQLGAGRLAEAILSRLSAAPAAPVAEREPDFWLDEQHGAPSVVTHSQKLTGSAMDGPYDDHTVPLYRQAAPAVEVDEAMATWLFDAGWYACADLADRDDLPHDIGSPFYEKKLAAALGREVDRG